MSCLLFRIMRRLDMTVYDFRADLRFSAKYALYRAGYNLLGRMGFEKASQHFHKKKISYEIQYLEAVLSVPLEKHKHLDIKGEYLENAPVWVCWWTGMDSAPTLVKQCVKSIQLQAGIHPVNIITKDNITSYLEIPAYINNKIKEGKMKLAHFADYLRVCLLNKYGGLWLDATIFCADRIPEWYFELPFFTCKSEYRESKYLSHYQWVTFCLGGWKGNNFYAFIKEALETYWLRNDYAIDYLFFDDIIFLAKKHVKAIRELMDAVPLNTPHRDDLQAAFNACLPAEAYDSIVCDDTPIYKLSWRETYSEITKEGAQSIYGFFITMRQ